MVRRRLAAGWPGVWFSGAEREARRLGRCTTSPIATSRPLVSGRPAGQGRAFSPAMCGTVGAVPPEAVACRVSCAREGSCKRWSALVCTMQPRERCGFDQSSMRSGRDSTAPRDLLAKHFLNPSTLESGQQHMTCRWQGADSSADLEERASDWAEDDDAGGDKRARVEGESCARGACAMPCRVDVCAALFCRRRVAGGHGLMQHASQISNQIIHRAASSELQPATRRRQQRSLSSRAH
jgi:hypothetical protein